MKILKSQLKEIIREVLEEKNWIKGAIKKPGALRKSMGVKRFQRKRLTRRLPPYIKRAKVIRN
jgi:hypothetical protein